MKHVKLGQNGIQANLEFIWNIKQKKDLFWEKRKKTIELKKTFNLVLKSQNEVE